MPSSHGILMMAKDFPSLPSSNPLYASTGVFGTSYPLLTDDEPADEARPLPRRAGTEVSCSVRLTRLTMRSKRALRLVIWRFDERPRQERVSVPTGDDEIMDACDGALMYLSYCFLLTKWRSCCETQNSVLTRLSTCSPRSSVRTDCPERHWSRIVPPLRNIPRRVSLYQALMTVGVQCFPRDLCRRRSVYYVSRKWTVDDGGFGESDAVIPERNLYYGAV